MFLQSTKIAYIVLSRKDILHVLQKLFSSLGFVRGGSKLTALHQIKAFLY